MLFSVREITYPKYKENTSSSGNDTAIIKISMWDDHARWRDIKAIKLCKTSSDIILYSRAKFIGYPDARREKDREIWGDYELKTKKTLAIYLDVDTSPAQSETPIFCHEDNEDDDKDR